MRDTAYAKEIATATLQLGESEARIERLHVKTEEQDEIRFSWWKDGRIMPRPLDLSETDLLALIQEALRKNVFSASFIGNLREAITDI